MGVLEALVYQELQRRQSRKKAPIERMGAFAGFVRGALRIQYGLAVGHHSCAHRLEDEQSDRHHHYVHDSGQQKHKVPTAG
jgi:hypothetical protein